MVTYRKMYTLLLFTDVINVLLTPCQLHKLQKDLPRVTDLYAKSDNAGSYQGNSYALYVMCKDKGFTLEWYDYNAKSLMRSYIDAGNNILIAKDVFKVLLYGKGIQNVKVACISISTSKATLSPCTTIPNISQYHSFEFHHDHMIMWRYFSIGEGKRWNYTNISVMPNITMVLLFSSTTSGISEGAGMSKKRRDDRTLCDLYFCTESGCVDSFKDVKAFKMHMVSGQHNAPTVASSIDHLKQCYVNMMKMSKTNALSTVSGQLLSSEKAHLIEYPDHLY